MINYFVIFKKKCMFDKVEISIYSGSNTYTQKSINDVMLKSSLKQIDMFN